MGRKGPLGMIGLYVHCSQKRASCNKSVYILEKICYQLVMCSHSLRQLAEDKSVASCQQTCCKLIDKACYQEACSKLF